MNRWVFSTLFVGLMTVPATANWITAYDCTGAYSLTQFPPVIVIQSAGTFKFYALDGSMPGVINSITVSENVTGTVHLYVVRDTGGYGAASVKEIDLSNAEWSVLHDVKVGSLGDPAESALAAADLEGPISVTALTIPPTDGEVRNDFVIRYLQGDIECASMQDLTAIALPTLGGGDHSGNITINGPYDGTIYIEGPISEE